MDSKDAQGTGVPVGPCTCTDNTHVTFDIDGTPHFLTQNCARTFPQLHSTVLRECASAVDVLVICKDPLLRPVFAARI